MRLAWLQSCWFVLLCCEALRSQDAPPANSPEYDVLIRGGAIVDGSGNPWFTGDVALKGDRIAAVGRKLAGSGLRVIDAKGLIVAPGFIDMHSHSDEPLLEDGLAQSKIRQGVTTEVLGEGTSAGPRVGKLSPRTMQLGDESISWSTLAEYFVDRRFKTSQASALHNRPAVDV